MVILKLSLKPFISHIQCEAPLLLHPAPQRTDPLLAPDSKLTQLTQLWDVLCPFYLISCVCLCVI